LNLQKTCYANLKFRIIIGGELEMLRIYGETVVAKLDALLDI